MEFYEEAVKYLKRLKVVRYDDYKGFNADSLKAQSFFIENENNLKLIKEVKTELIKFFKSGETAHQFVYKIDEICVLSGIKPFEYDKAESIFNHYIQTAYKVGHYQQMTSHVIRAVRPYWKYVAVHDNRTRPAHRAMDGLTFPADHEFWQTHYPPNGYNCRCMVRALSGRQVEAEGLKVLDKIPDWVIDPRTGEIITDISPDPGFAVNPARAWE
jgi:SPP1 gp7 family putative phage head morphogenesis protein